MENEREELKSQISCLHDALKESVKEIRKETGGLKKNQGREWDENEMKDAEDELEEEMQEEDPYMEGPYACHDSR